MTKLEKLKLGIFIQATALLKYREIDHEVTPMGQYIMEDISTAYEKKLLKQQLKEVDYSIYAYEYLNDQVPAILKAKKEVIEARIEAIK